MTRWSWRQGNIVCCCAQVFNSRIGDNYVGQLITRPCSKVIVIICFVITSYIVNVWSSGGSWGLGALGPAIIVWGPLQRCNTLTQRFPAGVVAQRGPGRAPEAKHFGSDIIIENWLNSRYLGRRLHPQGLIPIR